MTIQELQDQLRTVLSENPSISEEEKRFLLGNIELLNEDELQELITNNT